MDGVTVTEVFTCPNATVPLTEDFLLNKFGVDVSGIVSYCIDAPQTDTMTSVVNGTAVEHTSELIVHIPAEYAANITQFCADVMAHVQNANPQQCESMFRWLDTIHAEGGVPEVLSNGASRIPVLANDTGANALLDHGPYPGIFNSITPEGVGDFLPIPIQDFIRIFEQFVTTIQDAKARDVLFEALTTPMSPAAAQYSADASKFGASAMLIIAGGIILTFGLPLLYQAISEKASSALSSRKG